VAVRRWIAQKKTPWQPNWSPLQRLVAAVVARLVGTLSSWMHRWVNDNDMRIAQAGDLAYDFVTDPDAKSTDVGSRISRQVGTKANGEPLRAYLMETPDEEYRAGLAEKEAVTRQIDDAMTRIVDEHGKSVPVTEQTGQVSIQRDR